MKMELQDFQGPNWSSRTSNLFFLCLHMLNSNSKTTRDKKHGPLWHSQPRQRATRFGPFARPGAFEIWLSRLQKMNWVNREQLFGFWVFLAPTGQLPYSSLPCFPRVFDMFQCFSTPTSLLTCLLTSLFTCACPLKLSDPLFGCWWWWW